VRDNCIPGSPFVGGRWCVGRSGQSYDLHAVTALRRSHHLECRSTRQTRRTCRCITGMRRGARFEASATTSDAWAASRQGCIGIQTAHSSPLRRPNTPRSDRCEKAPNVISCYSSCKDSHDGEGDAEYGNASDLSCPCNLSQQQGGGRQTGYSSC